MVDINNLHPLLRTAVQPVASSVQSEALIRAFSTPVFKSRITDKDLVKRMADNLLELKHTGQGFPTHGAFSTRDDLQTLPQFFELCDIILDEINKVLDTLTVERDDHYISCMWSNIAKVGVPHLEHFHPNSYFSGVIYFQVPPGSGDFYITDPRAGPQMFLPKYTKPSAEFVGSDLQLKPELGVMFIFPSWLKHGVNITEYRPDLPERISLSFNIMIRTKIDLPTARWTIT
jgi:uncharacterized protein (TIGR02466 family)